MLVNCIECHKEVDAKEELQRHSCGILYGLTPYFPYDEYYLKKKKEIKK